MAGSKERVRRRYEQAQDRLDRALVRGQVNIIFWLGGAALLLALGAALVVTLLHLAVRGQSPGFAQAFWQSLVRTIDPGQITDDHAGMAILGLLVTIVGLLLVSTLISLINNRIERRVEGIRRGRDPIGAIEDHVVLLGWSDISSKVVEEFWESGGKEHRVDMVVLAAESVDVMHHELVEKELGARARGWPILRSGSPSDVRDLEQLASVPTARSVVILDDGSEDGFANSVKTVMAVVAACDGPDESHAPHELPTVVVEVPDKSDGLIDRLSARLRRFGFRVVAVDSLALRTELAAQVSRRAGLSQVFRDLLNFSGEELYIVPAPKRVETFGAALTAMSTRVPMGLIDERGGVDLWPAWSTPIAGRRLVVIASDDVAATSDADLREEPAVDGVRPDCCGRPLEQQHLLVVGWNQGAPHLLEVLDQYAGDGSTVTVVTERGIDSQRLKLGSFEKPAFIAPEMGVQAWLDQERTHFDHAIVLSDDDLSPAASDALTFVTLLALRPAGEHRGNPTTVVAQLRERANKHLARQSLADDLVVGDALTATTLAQLAMSPDLEPVLDKVLGQTPYTIELVPNRDQGERSSTTFAAITRDTAEHGEVALGWVTDEGEVRLSPPKDTAVPNASIRQVVVFTRLRLEAGSVDARRTSTATATVAATA